MKTRRVVWSRDALSDLTGIITYIAEDSPGAARRVSALIRGCGRRLGTHASGRVGRVSGTYEKVVPRMPWIMAYVIATSPDSHERIEIVRVIHGARDWPDESWPG